MAVPNTGQGNGRIQQRHKDQFKPAPAISEKALCLLKLHCLANRGPRLVGPRLRCETLIRRERSGIENKAAPKRLEGSGPGPAPRGRTRVPLASLWNVTSGDDTESMTQKELLLAHHHMESSTVSGITDYCLAPDHITPKAVTKSLQGPSGPSSAVTETGIKGCGFKNIINKDLQCPEEHLQAGK